MRKIEKKYQAAGIGSFRCPFKSEPQQGAPYAGKRRAEQNAAGGTEESLLIKSQAKKRNQEADMEEQKKQMEHTADRTQAADGVRAADGALSQSAVPAENKMGVMPCNRLLLGMSVPIMISMLVQALYNVVDSILWRVSMRMR